MGTVTTVESVKNTLFSLRNVLECLSKDQFAMPLAVLSGATIGQHTRHVIELFQELEKGYLIGKVNYDLRVRNVDLEMDKDAALDRLKSIPENLNKDNITMSLAVGIISENEKIILTSYERELLYNLEHTIHHMAIIRIGIQTFGTIEIPEHFGVSSATLTYRKTCAQ